MAFSPNPNPPGVPRTDEQRRKEHEETYGTSELPERGSGLNPGPEVNLNANNYAQNISILAGLEIIRVNQFEPFTMTKVMNSGIHTTSQKLIFDVFEVGYVYIITSICGIDVDDAAHQIRIGVTDGVTDLVFESATVANAGDSVEYVGQLMLKETDKVYVEFRSVGNTDTIRANMNGYRIRR